MVPQVIAAVAKGEGAASAEDFCDALLRQALSGDSEAGRLLLNFPLPLDAEAEDYRSSLEEFFRPLHKRGCFR